MRDGDPNYHALDKYYPEMNEQAVAFLSQGKSNAALSAHFDISEETLRRWMREKPEFNDAVMRGRAQGQAMWESSADSNMENKNYNATLYIFKMKSQYRVKDGSEPSSIQAMIGAETSTSVDAQELFKMAVAQAKERGDL